MSAVRAPGLTWSPSLDRRSLATEGCDVIEFSALCREVVGPAREAGARRTTTANPAHEWLERVGRARTLAVLGVRIRDLDDLAALHGYVLQPALRAGVTVAVESPDRISRLAPERFVDPLFEYPYTLERALYAATTLLRGPQTLSVSGAVSAPSVALDAEQRRAVEAGDGVVQVIAPAGSGKTAVLIERVRELLSRGTPAKRILCTTFNRDARIELEERLAAAELGSVEARTFHSIGRRLMSEQGLLRQRVRELSLNEWRRLCAVAAHEEGNWQDPAEARSAISTFKLGLLATPAEFRRQAGEHADGQVLARIYELYEQYLAEQQVHDFDDLVFVAVRALREDGDLRAQWQGRFRQVLVDEYQDIEPAQELLVRILAAPEDEFFCVGDEDQTLYGWRRASVRRIIELDVAYPGLQRVSLAHNYRCPPEIVDASRQLIEHNEIRFPKSIHPHPERRRGGETALAVQEHDDRLHAARAVAHVLAGSSRGQIVVLARTTNLLRAVALGCADLDVKITAPEQVFEAHGARAALEAYLRLCAAPAQARGDDVALVCRVPSRGLPFDSDELVASRLRAGLSFTESFADLRASAWQRTKLDAAGPILDALAAITDARQFVGYLRGAGGLDKYFAEHEQTFGGTEQVELEVLEEAEREASGHTVPDYSELLQAHRDRLQAIRDDVHGIELTTIHRAKGREWPEVHLFGCDEGQLPHRRSLEAGADARAQGEGIEAERRLAYVAFTRAQARLVIHAGSATASRFLIEAGLKPRPVRDSAGPAGARHSKPPSPPRDRRAVTISGPAGLVIDEAQRIGLAYALRTAPNRAAALEAAAVALERGLVGPSTTSSRMTVADLLQAIEELNDSERAGVLRAAAITDRAAHVVRLPQGLRFALARALRALA